MIEEIIADGFDIAGWTIYEVVTPDAITFWKPRMGFFDMIYDLDLNRWLPFYACPDGPDKVTYTTFPAKSILDAVERYDWE